MAEITWIKLKTDMFDNDKIKLIERMPEGDGILMVWLNLFLRSSKDKSFKIINISDYPIEEYVSVITGRTLNLVKTSLRVLTQHKLIEEIENGIEVKRFWLTNQEWRTTKEYKEWRNAVFNRDNYTCQSCKVRGGKLNAHHIKSFSKYEGLRFDVSNGVTLCYTCHKEVHYG